MLRALRYPLGAILLSLALAPAVSASNGDRSPTPRAPATPHLQWLRKLGGRGYDSAHAVAIGVDGSIFVAAADQRDPRKFPTGQAPTVGRLLKLTPEGKIAWSRAFRNVQFEGIALDSEGTIFATGTRGWQHGDERGTDLVVLRLDSEGRREWSFAHRADDSAAGADLAVAAEGSLYVVGTEHAGFAHDSSDRYESLLVLKLDRDGELAAAARIQDAMYRFTGTGVDVQGSSVYVSGSRGPAKHEEFDFWNRGRAAVVARFDAGLAQRWVTVADPALVGRLAITGSDVVVVPDGAVLVGSAGVTTDNDPSRSSKGQMLALRVNASGEVIWQRRYGGRGADGGTGIAALESGGSLIAGGSWPGHGPYASMAAWALTDSGDRVWSTEFGRPVELGWGQGVASRDGYAVVVGGLKEYGDPTQFNIVVARYRVD